MSGENKFRLIAFYLPQFHPIPENDAWWGEGFTEWNNVVRAKPLFPAHYQPHLPSGELGFYDLRSSATRQMQADLASAYGISGFCYYHYWFHGKRLLERPFNEVLRSGQPDFPFCLCWANESWTRTWDGGNRQCLVEQKYSDEDDRQHIRWLIQAFEDRRYIRIDAKPVFLVYRANKIPNPLKTTDIWREEAHKAGVGDIYLCRVESFPDEHTDPHKIGFDAAVEFQPDWASWPVSKKIIKHLSLDLRFKYRDIYPYSSFIQRMMRKTKPAYPRFPCVTPSWDNTARNKIHTTILDGSTPDLYETWFTTILKTYHPRSPEENLVFINAWNEWGEGNHLEPCQKWEKAYLEATRQAVISSQGLPRSNKKATDLIKESVNESNS